MNLSPLESYSSKEPPQKEPPQISTYLALLDLLIFPYLLLIFLYLPLCCCTNQARAFLLEMVAKQH